MVLIHHQARGNTATARVMRPVREHMLPKMKMTIDEHSFASQNDMFQQADWLRQPEPAFSASTTKQSIIPTLNANEALHVCFNITSSL